jgi:cell division protein FtsI (penicillin-binding protein 3)
MTYSSRSTNRKPRYLFKARFIFLSAVLGFLFVTLLGRQLYLHLFNQDFLLDQGRQRFERLEVLPAHRGEIVDRNGEILAMNAAIATIWFNPKQVNPDAKEWGKLAQLLSIPQDKLKRKLLSQPKQSFVYLKRQVEPKLGEKIKALKLAGLYVDKKYKRFYPAAEVAAHVLGFTNLDGQGQEGLEWVYNSVLTGEEGSQRVLQTPMGAWVNDLGVEKAPVAGKKLELSLDLRMQYVAYRALKETVQKFGAHAGSAVAVDVETGEILALVNQPSFNPNNRSQFKPEWMRNRAAIDLFEPGSTFKPFTVAAILEQDFSWIDKPIDTHPGTFRVGRKLIRDHSNYGVMSVSGVLAKSSNIGSVHLAFALEDRADLANLHRALGFGQVTDVGFPGEVSGVVPSFKRWSDIHLATLSYGYGVSVSALQLVQSYAVIASGGIKRPLTLVKRTPEDVNQLKQERVLSSKVAFALWPMMEEVTSIHGTAQKAKVAGFRVAGKTGTVHKSQATGGYAKDKYRSFFAGFAPVDNPKIALLVVVDEPQGAAYYGGLVAAPVFQEIMAKMLYLRGVAPSPLPIDFVKDVDHG